MYILYKCIHCYQNANTFFGELMKAKCIEKVILDCRNAVKSTQNQVFYYFIADCFGSSLTKATTTLC